MRSPRRWPTGISTKTSETVAADLRARLARGEFDSLSEPEAFAAAVTDVLQRETRDRHLWIWYRQGAVAPVQFSSVEGPMIARAQMLPGKIGYLDIRHFVGMTPELDAAMAAVKTRLPS